MAIRLSDISFKNLLTNFAAAIILFRIIFHSVRCFQLRITMKEIAKMANVSATTVSKVLNHRDMGISEATKEKIFSIADGSSLTFE